jgi:hypothetical protein
MFSIFEIAMKLSEVRNVGRLAIASVLVNLEVLVGSELNKKRK